MTVTKHAMEQYLFKCCGISGEAKEKTKSKALHSIQTRVEAGEEIELSVKEATIRLINNHGVLAKYIYHSGMLFVVIDQTVVTCYPFPKTRIAKRVKH